MNIGIICSCLPVISIFYHHLVNLVQTRKSKSSTYLELDTLEQNAGTGVERARPNEDETGQRREEGVGSVALHQQYLRSVGGTQTAAVTSIGARDTDHLDGSWDGSGILKTVRLDTWQTPASDPEGSLLRPPTAVVHSSKPETRDTK